MTKKEIEKNAKDFMIRAFAYAEGARYAVEDMKRGIITKEKAAEIIEDLNNSLLDEEDLHKWMNYNN